MKSDKKEEHLANEIFELLRHGIHIATDCNATSRCSQLQRVWGSVAASCSQLQISDSVRYFLRRSVALQVVAACMPGSCKYKNP